MTEKTRRSGSAAQRREHLRKERQAHEYSERNYSRSRRRTKQESNPWPMIIGLIAVCVVVVGIFWWLSHNQNSGNGTNAYNTVTHPDATILASIGGGSAQSKFKALPPNANVPPGPSGKPQILYIGADYCPYCGAQRWAIISALSRFGTFGPLETNLSGEASVPTFTFHKSHYSSSVIDFVPVETADNSGAALEKLTDEQAKLFATYDAPPYTDATGKGSIPLLLVGNKYTATGAFYLPDNLIGRSYDDIAQQLKDSNSTVARDVLGASNYITAAICQLTNNQPANVCTAAPIPSLQSSLPKASAYTDGGFQTGGLFSMPEMLVRRPE